MIHAGHLIEQTLREQRHSVPWLAEQLCCHRTNIYRLFHKENIDIVLMYRIGLALHCNLFEVYVDALNEEMSATPTSD